MHARIPAPLAAQAPWVVVIVLVVASGCERGAITTTNTTTTTTTTTTTAAQPEADAMCAKHGVLEAVCTKCNPALIPVFKAKGDWCDEHGFPESFCPTCHPERGGKPAVDVSDTNDGPADGLQVQLKHADTATLAGLKLAKAEAGSVTRQVPATARIVYDATRVAQINPRMPGVVRALRVDVGAAVRPGTPLAVIESAQVGAEQSRLSAASARVAVAEATHERVSTLRTEGISSQRALLDAQRERDEARADAQAARAALGMVGASNDGSARYTLTSPIAGVVTQRNASIGKLVDPSEIVFEIVDPSSVWLELDVPEAELALVRVGQPIVATFDALPDRELTAEVAYVAPSVDPRTRTAAARAPLANPDGALRANLFGRGRIIVTDPRAALWVPRAAVQRARKVDVLFVRMADDLFDTRRVTVGPTDGERVSVSGRLKPGDEVVTEGSFLLKTETLKESIGAGCCAAD